jgi:hypothetical protein
MNIGLRQRNCVTCDSDTTVFGLVAFDPDDIQLRALDHRVVEATRCEVHNGAVSSDQATRVEEKLTSQYVLPATTACAALLHRVTALEYRSHSTVLQM